MDYTKLAAAALDARAYAYAPYSHFAVGAALLGESGKIYTGCNVENISLRLTICAEQAALAAAVAGGETKFAAIAVAADSEEPVVPCGACRQLLAEFNPGIEVISSTLNGRRQTWSLRELLPSPAQGILESFRHE